MTYVIVFRSRLRAGVEEEYGRLANQIYEIAVKMPGYISIKDFVAEDGERVAVAEFDTAEHLIAWRDQPDHRAAQAVGREKYYDAYSITIAHVERSSAFDRATGVWRQLPAPW